jgi:hypothetical protein
MDPSPFIFCGAVTAPVIQSQQGGQRENHQWENPRGGVTPPLRIQLVWGFREG